MKPVVLLLGLPALVLGLAAAALAQTYTIVDVPDAGGTWPVSINNGGDVAGYFCRNVGGYCSDYQARGFVREFNGNITAFDGIPTSINDLGTVTGYFFDTTGLHNFCGTGKATSQCSMSPSLFRHLRPLASPWP